MGIQQFKIKKTIENIEAWVRVGDIANARRKLQSLEIADVPKNHYSQFANLARRVRLNALALKLLFPIVYDKSTSKIKADDCTVAEYAACLTDAGVFNEALDLLESLEGASVPVAHFYKALALRKMWDYEQSILQLEKFLSFPNISFCQHLIAEIHLISSLISVKKYMEAERLLKSSLSRVKDSKNKAALLTLIQQEAILNINNHKFDRAEKLLTQSEMYLNNTGGLDSINQKKWKAILELLKSSGDEKTFQNIHLLKQDAELFRDWESIRQFDYYLAKVSADEKIYSKLYFGTPFESYRSDLAHKFNVPTYYEWNVNSSSEQRVVNSKFDVDLGCSLTSEAELKPGQVMHKALVKLSSDFYRPFQVGELFSFIFKGEKFNPTTSPVRVTKSIERLRRWLLSNDIPVEILRRENKFFLKGSGDCVLIKSHLNYLKSEQDYNLLRLKSVFDKSNFLASDASLELGVSVRTCNRIINNAIEQGQLTKVGMGRNTAYCFS